MVDLLRIPSLLYIHLIYSTKPRERHNGDIPRFRVVKSISLGAGQNTFKDITSMKLPQLFKDWLIPISIVPEISVNKNSVKDACYFLSFRN